MTEIELVALARETRDHVAGDLPNGVGNQIDALCDTIESLSERIAVQDDILRSIIGNANEAPRFGPFDQIDNDGEPYQSEAFSKALDRGRAHLANTSLIKEGSHAEG